MTSAEWQLRLDSVALRRGDRLLVDGLSLELSPGQLALVTGPNGSGKTTLLRAIAGLSPVSGGSIRIGSRPIGQLEADVRGGIGYYGHLDGLKKDLTVAENIMFFRLLRGQSKANALPAAGLAIEPLMHRYVRQLSAGQRRRAALAILGDGATRLWLLDEPLTNLDSQGRDLIGEWVTTHLANGGLAVVATHFAESLMRPGCLHVEL